MNDNALRLLHCACRTVYRLIPIAADIYTILEINGSSRTVGLIHLSVERHEKSNLLTKLVEWIHKKVKAQYGF